MMVPSFLSGGSKFCTSQSEILSHTFLARRANLPSRATGLVRTFFMFPVTGVTRQVDCEPEAERTRPGVYCKVAIAALAVSATDVCDPSALRLSFSNSIRRGNASRA